LAIASLVLLLFLPISLMNYDYYCSPHSCPPSPADILAYAHSKCLKKFTQEFSKLRQTSKS
jgi:hypothetical protein